MNNIWVIIKREYLSRIKNKAFIIMTLLAPLLITIFYGGAIFVATKGAEDHRTKIIYVITENPLITLPKLENYKFLSSGGSMELKSTLEKSLNNEDIDGIIEIKDKELHRLDSAEIIVKKAFPIVQMELINQTFKNEITANLLRRQGISPEMLDSNKVNGSLTMLEQNASGEVENSSAGLKSSIGMVMAFLIYMFIFAYGAMVMRSAMEEKTNRIVEVIVSSVRPFQLMMGKILGVAMVGLTQFILWIILSFSFIAAIGGIFGKQIMSNIDDVPKGLSSGGTEAIEKFGNHPDFLSSISSLPYAQIIVVFALFFLGGYLLYSSLFAAIGAAVNHDTDVQQFMLPVSLPLVFGIIIAQSVVFQSPNGQLAKIFSMIPLTSPVVMAARAPFGISWSEISISAAILIATFIFMVWVSSKIYRIGILMYGKKPSWKDFVKWIRQSN